MLTYKITQVDDGGDGYYEVSSKEATITANSLEAILIEIMETDFGVQFTHEFREENE